MEEDAVLSDDNLLERILSFLPTTSLINAAAVSKRWYVLVKCPWTITRPPEVAWYLMTIFIGSNPIHVVYDQSLRRRWFAIKLPVQIPFNRYIDPVASGGLICRIKAGELFVFNPISKAWRMLPSNPDLEVTTSRRIAMSASPKNYIVSVVNYKDSQLSIWIYESKTKNWLQALSQLMNGFKLCSCLIYGSVLYSFLAASSDNTNWILRYGLSLKLRPPFAVTFRVTSMANPCLISLKEKVIIVFLIGKKIVIGELHDEAWSKMASQLWERWGDTTESRDFSYSGAGEILNVQDRFSPDVLTFDVTRKCWEWLPDLGTSSRPLRLYNGVFFQPNMKMDC